MIITLVLLGKFMESRAKRGTTAAIRQLMDLRPQTAQRYSRTRRRLKWSCLSPRSAKAICWSWSDRASAFPLTARSDSGDQRTGRVTDYGREPAGIEERPGDKVTGGAINGTGLTRVIRATTVGEDSTLSKIIKLVENAQAGKAPVQRLVDQHQSRYSCRS